MNRLSSVIGSAPSELTFAVFCDRLTTERNRVRHSLEEFRKRRALPKSGKATPKAAKTIAALAKAYSLSPADLAKGLALIESQKKQKQLPQEGIPTL